MSVRECVPAWVLVVGIVVAFLLGIGAGLPIYQIIGGCTPWVPDNPLEGLSFMEADGTDTYPSESVTAVGMSVDAKNDSLVLTVMKAPGPVLWSDYMIFVDGIELKNVSSKTTSQGSSVTMNDPNGSWDPIEGTFCSVRVVDVNTNLVVYFDEIMVD